MVPLCRVIEEGQLCGSPAAVMEKPWPCTEHLCLFQGAGAVRCRGIPQRLKNLLETRVPAGYRPDLDGSFYCDHHVCGYGCERGIGVVGGAGPCQGHVVPDQPTAYCGLHACARVRASLGGRRCLRPVIPGRRHCEQCDRFFCTRRAGGMRCGNPVSPIWADHCARHRCATGLLPVCTARAVDDGRFCAIHTCRSTNGAEGGPRFCVNHVTIAGKPPPPPPPSPLLLQLFDWGFPLPVRNSGRSGAARLRLLQYCAEHRCRLCEGRVRNGSQSGLCAAHDAAERRQIMLDAVQRSKGNGLFVYMGATR